MLSKLRTTLFFEERLANCLDVHPSRASACLPTVRLVKWTGPDLSAVVLAVMLRPCLLYTSDAADDYLTV